MRRPDRLLFPLLAALVLAGCAASPAPRASSAAHAHSTSPIAQRSINAAQALIERGDAAGALVEAERAVKADSRSALARVIRGTAFEALGRGLEAGEDYKQAVRLSPGSGAVLNAYGAWLCRAGRIDEALKAFSDAIVDEAYRQPTQALANAGSCASEAGRDEQAEFNFRAVLQMSPENAQALSGMARLEHRRGDALRARAFLQRREALAPLTAPELALAIEIETAAGDARAATRYRNQLATLAAEVEAGSTPSDTGSSKQ
ncbi:type IV pilus biogenesis/stability protein PilW [Silanimonas sp.]|jgi:type IV pilus assembly protein PilF|uniref:type IV pilus biogenesis/stability protein PilW n=1 Tax=Silanimonas sp. TaxID=1929290 RepID=UPI0022C4F771|nr:type IV pilus biogenesis/stability protein PilW [Silanimonas sp.]MCZ8113584.1 type IV pilus biogenesis/stability protein PilW [Silanimonas sp.]